MTAPRSFSEWAAEYEHFDLPSLLAEGITLDDNEPVNRLTAMFVRLVDIVTRDELSPADRVKIIRFANVLQADVERALQPDRAMSERFDAARRAQYENIEKFAPYPEFGRLILPARLAPGP